MTDREQKIAEIREVLEVIKRYDLSTLDNIMMPVYNFCVNAPEWLRFLLSQLDRRDEENRKLREERDKMIEVLRWYADTKNYEYRTSYLDQDAPIIDDNGQRARDILKEIGVTVE